MLDVYRISFEPEHLYMGLGLIVTAGPGGFTKKENEFLVTEAALRLLDERKVPYEIVSGPKSYAARKESRDDT